mgnify:FL=1|jgi:thiamine biosynthesis protein ThiI
MTESTASSSGLLVLVRLAPDVTLKSRRVRARFLKRLARNLRDAVQPRRLELRWSRVLVELEGPAQLPTLERVFGVKSFSPVEAAVEPTLEAIVRTGEALYRDRVTGRRFAVRATCRGTPFSSKDVEIALGAALRPYAARVDLTRPEVVVEVEARGGQAWLLGPRHPGPGGVPVGVAGRAVLLLSGGYDSAVAAWRLLKRGVALDYVFCNLGGDAYERAVVQVAKHLAEAWSYGTRPRLYVLDFGPLQDALRTHVRPAYAQVILKRLFYRAACAVARRRRALAIATGEAIGQVSSQTLANLRAIEPAADRPVLRPLLGFDKEEIIAEAERIGTATLSAHVREYCAVVPTHPVTAATIRRVDDEEAKLDPNLLRAAVRGGKRVDLRALEPVDLVAPYLFVDRVPEGALVLDLRPASQFVAWHYPGAQRVDPSELLRQPHRLDKTRTYVLVCPYGVESAYVAERLQRWGLEAYSFRGGLRGLARYARAQGMAVPAGV